MISFPLSLEGVGHDMKVSTADFVKNYGALADQALSEPLTITRNGRDRRICATKPSKVLAGAGAGVAAAGAGFCSFDVGAAVGAGAVAEVSCSFDVGAGPARHQPAGTQ